MNVNVNEALMRQDAINNQNVNQLCDESAKRNWLMRVKHFGHIVRSVLQGYFLGQPPDESKPRKGCC